MSKSNNRFFSYKNKPLVRSGDTIYYGNMYESHVIMLQIKDTEKVGDIELPKNVSVKLMVTDQTVAPTDVIVKTSEKVGLHNAMDIADIWLSKALEG